MTAAPGYRQFASLGHCVRQAVHAIQTAEPRAVLYSSSRGKVHASRGRQAVRTHAEQNAKVNHFGGAAHIFGDVFWVAAVDLGGSGGMDIGTLLNISIGSHRAPARRLGAAQTASSLQILICQARTNAVPIWRPSSVKRRDILQIRSSVLLSRPVCAIVRLNVVCTRPWPSVCSGSVSTYVF